MREKERGTHAVDEVGDLGEEGVILREPVDLLVVVSRSSNEKGGVVVGVLELELVSVGVDLKLARVGLALEGNGVGELSDGARLVLPAVPERGG